MRPSSRKFRAVNRNSRRLENLFIQKVPQPAIHPILRRGTHFANLEQMGSVIFQESRSCDEVERWHILRVGTR